jgi:hypothetical protein
VMKKKYVIHPGLVKSKSDGDVHFISSARLCELYGVRWEECIKGRPGWERGYTPEFRSTLIHLAPDSTGEYKRPDKEQSDE